MTNKRFQEFLTGEKTRRSCLSGRFRWQYIDFLIQQSKHCVDYQCCPVLSVQTLKSTRMICRSNPITDMRLLQIVIFTSDVSTEYNVSWSAFCGPKSIYTIKPHLNTTSELRPPRFLRPHTHRLVSPPPPKFYSVF